MIPNYGTLITMLINREGIVQLFYSSWSSLGEDFKQIIACLAALEPSDTSSAARFGFLMIALLLRDPKHLDHPEQPSGEETVVVIRWRSKMRVWKGCIYLKRTRKNLRICIMYIYHASCMYILCIMYLYVYIPVQYNKGQTKTGDVTGASTPTWADLA